MSVPSSGSHKVSDKALLKKGPSLRPPPAKATPTTTPTNPFAVALPVLQEVHDTAADVMMTRNLLARLPYSLGTPSLLFDVDRQIWGQEFKLLPEAFYRMEIKTPILLCKQPALPISATVVLKMKQADISQENFGRDLFLLELLLVLSETGVVSVRETERPDTITESVDREGGKSRDGVPENVHSTAVLLSNVRVGRCACVQTWAHHQRAERHC